MIDVDEVDVYIDHLRIPRNVSNRSIEVLSDTDLKNIDVWDPGEELMIKINKTITDSESHTLRVTTSNGVIDEEIFSV